MVKDNLSALYEKLPSAVKLVAVSKFHPVERLMEAYDAGQRVFGENRPQELAAKIPQMPSDVEWHFIGHLQTNKLKLVLPYVSLVQSVDSLHLLEAIAKWGRENGKTVDVLLELHLGAEETKHGFSEEEILMLLNSGSTPSENLRSLCDLRSSHKWAPPSDVPRVAQFSEGVLPPQGIRIRGLMGMATNTEDEEVIEADFARIEALFKRIREGHPELRETFTELSIGMSGDWPIAVRHGATMVRIGTDIFGAREY
jgi:uncharacterized pyridoxal phosphate-containing UPF0001 family protein